MAVESWVKDLTEEVLGGPPGCQPVIFRAG